MTNKTVYILGAGASYNANIPLQKDIIKTIYSINSDSFKKKSNKQDLINLEINEAEETLIDNYDTFNENRIVIGKFILKIFSKENDYQYYVSLIEYINTIFDDILTSNNKSNKYLKMAFNKILKCNITLEDIFTIFDIFSANKQYISYFSDKEINEFNKKLQMCIVYAISYNITFLSKTDEYLAFSSLLLEQIDSNDNVSVITTNWDNLFEKSLSFLCEKYNSKAPKQKHIYPTYSFDNYPFYYKIEDKSKTAIKNNLIKVLKLHGSVSWLECPRCGRVYIDYKKDIATKTFNETTCVKCSEELKKDDRPILRNIIITPTYLKSLNSLCIKNTWQNAFFTLNEASKIVFIGYSFPEADFEMRSLLKKSIRKDANINVILCKSDNPKHYDKMIKVKNKMNKKKIIEKINLPEQRYKSFFGGNNLEFYYGGFLRYIEKARSK